METHYSMKQKDHKSHPKGLFSFFRRFGQWINEMFQPEEVEVTFKDDGKNVTYTYTKVAHKQVAW